MPDEPLILVLPARFDAERMAVAQAWAANGGAVEFLERFWEPPALPRERVRLYGDQVFCLVVAEKLGLNLVSPPDDFLAQIEPRWLNRQLTIMSLQEAQIEQFPRFVKPLTPKQFPAAVYSDSGALIEATVGVAPDASVFVSEPVTFLCEARCLVRTGVVTAASIYEGKCNADTVTAFVQDFVRQNLVPVTVGLDVGWIDGRGWGVIEANPIWGMGLNGCDPAALAACLRLATNPT